MVLSSDSESQTNTARNPNSWFRMMPIQRQRLATANNSTYNRVVIVIQFQSAPSAPVNAITRVLPSGADAINPIYERTNPHRWEARPPAANWRSLTRQRWLSPRVPNQLESASCSCARDQATSSSPRLRSSQAHHHRPPHPKPPYRKPEQSAAEDIHSALE
jgi:hypothetical protein